MDVYLCVIRESFLVESSWHDQIDKLVFLILSMTQRAAFCNRSILSFVSLKVSKIQQFVCDHVQNSQLKTSHFTVLQGRTGLP